MNAVHPQFDAVDDGVITIDGADYMRDGRGALIPVALIKPTDKLIDQTVRTIMGYAISLSEQVSRFKEHTFDDLGALEALLDEKYGARLGGPKGHKTLMSHDTLFKVRVQVADNITFGPELQVAKGLIDECLNEWAEGARDEIRTIVTRAFNTDKEGQINKAELFMLLRLEIEDARWNRAMEAIRASIRVTGSKEYVRFYQRSSLDEGWQAITIDLSKA